MGLAHFMQQCRKDQTTCKGQLLIVMRGCTERRWFELHKARKSLLSSLTPKASYLRVARNRSMGQNLHANLDLRNT
eukprot:5427572-Amphidinium_carterae.1